MESKIEVPEKQIKNPKDQYFIEHFVQDKEILDEYKELFKPFRQRGRFMLFYTTALCIGLFYYAKNVNYFAERWYPTKRKGLHNLFFISMLHCFLFTGLLVVGNFAIIGTTPGRFLNKYSKLDEKILEQDPNPNMTVEQFLEVLNKEFFQSKKI